MLHSTLPTVTSDLFIATPDRVRLIGTTCQSCGALYFPKTASCRNPACDEKHIVDTQIGPKGVLYSWTLQAYQPPPPFHMDDWRPYLIGLVDMEQGLRVLGLLDMDKERVTIGMALILDAKAMYRDEDGETRFTYCFTPDDSGARQS